MITVKDIVTLIEQQAPLLLQEEYDNAGLNVGSPDMEAIGALLCIDVTEEVIDEAISNKLNLIISHHPLIFGGVKQLTGKNEVQRCIIKAIKNNIAIYAAHTNLDNVLNGVNGKIAEKIGLKNIKILAPKENELLKFITFVPQRYAEEIRKAIFNAGAGNIGNYDECSFNSSGYGTFRGNKNTNQFVGKIGVQHSEAEIRVEVILPKHKIGEVVAALKSVHPYEEPAYDIVPLLNSWDTKGAGIVGELEIEMEEMDFLLYIKNIFKIKMLKYTSATGKKIKKVAACGGAGSKLLINALNSGADAFVSGDFKYHEYFDAKSKILVADIGHFESEQFTKEIFYEIITKKMPTFAVRISKVKTNPINYL